MTEKSNRVLSNNWAKIRKSVVCGSRLATAKYRRLPDFMIIGAMKCGTSSLYSYITQHPKIIGARKKEVHYFDWNYEKGTDWYKSNFPLQGKNNATKLTGEGTPMYMFCPVIAKRIHEQCPDIKLIVLLKNPVDRAISHYYHSLRSGREDKSIMDALLAEEDRTRESIERMSQGDCKWDKNLIWHTYKSRGLYLDQIEDYWQYFDPDQILILSTEQLTVTFDKEMAKVFSFLGVDAEFIVPDLRQKNVGQKKQEIKDDVTCYLKNYFLEPNKRLFEAIGKDLGWNN